MVKSVWHKLTRKELIHILELQTEANLATLKSLKSGQDEISARLNWRVVCWDCRGIFRKLNIGGE